MSGRVRLCTHANVPVRGCVRASQLLEPGLAGDDAEEGTEGPRKGPELHRVRQPQRGDPHDGDCARARAGGRREGKGLGAKTE